MQREVQFQTLLLQVGLGVAVDYVNELGIEAIWKRIQHLAGILRKKLAAVPGAHVHDTGRILCGIVSFSLVVIIFLLIIKLHFMGSPRFFGFCWALHDTPALLHACVYRQEHVPAAAA